MFETEREKKTRSPQVFCRDVLRAIFGCYYVPDGAETLDENEIGCCLDCLCCVGSKGLYEDIKLTTELLKELELELPTNANLATHDGVLYFPKELLPDSAENVIKQFKTQNFL